MLVHSFILSFFHSRVQCEYSVSHESCQPFLTGLAGSFSQQQLCRPLVQSDEGTELLTIMRVDTDVLQQREIFRWQSFLCMRSFVLRDVTDAADANMDWPALKEGFCVVV